MALYFRNTGNTNYNVTTNWSTTDGGASAGVIPTATDDVFFTSNSGPCAVNATSVAKTLTFTGYVQTISFTTFNLTVSGNLIYASGMTMSSTGSNGIVVNASANITTAGLDINAPLMLSGAITVTLLDNMIISKLFSNNSSSTVTLNGFQVTMKGDFGVTGNGGILQGTTNLIYTGTAGTWTTGSVTGHILNNLTINSAGNLTIGSTGIKSFRTGTLTHTAGNVITTGSTLSISGNCTMNCAGITWNIISITSGSPIITLNSVLNASSMTLGNANSGVTWAGTAGYNVGTLVIGNSNTATHTYKSGITYACTSTFTATSPSGGQKTTMNSDTPGTRAIFNFTGTSQNVGHVNATDIDSSGGKTIYSFNGTLSNTLNWSVLSSDIVGGPQAKTFIN